MLDLYLPFVSMLLSQHSEVRSHPKDKISFIYPQRYTSGTYSIHNTELKKKKWGIIKNQQQPLMKTSPFYTHFDPFYTHFIL